MFMKSRRFLEIILQNPQFSAKRFLKKKCLQNSRFYVRRSTKTFSSKTLKLFLQSVEFFLQILERLRNLTILCQEHLQNPRFSIRRSLNKISSKLTILALEYFLKIFKSSTILSREVLEKNFHKSYHLMSGIPWNLFFKMHEILENPKFTILSPRSLKIFSSK